MEPPALKPEKGNALQSAFNAQHWEAFGRAFPSVAVAGRGSVRRVDYLAEEARGFRRARHTWRSSGASAVRFSRSRTMDSFASPWRNNPLTKARPIMTNSEAPVMPAAARMICSSCCRCMAEAGLDLPDFRGREQARDGRILAQPLGVV